GVVRFSGSARSSSSRSSNLPPSAHARARSCWPFSSIYAAAAKGFTEGFTSRRCRRTSGLLVSGVSDGRGEQCELAGVPVHVAPVVALDHLDRGPAVVSEPLDVAPLGERDGDERVAGRIELPWPHARAAERAVPVLLHEPLLVDRRAGHGRED